MHKMNNIITFDILEKHTVYAIICMIACVGLCQSDWYSGGRGFDPWVLYHHS